MDLDQLEPASVSHLRPASTLDDAGALHHGAKRAPGPRADEAEGGHT